MIANLAKLSIGGDGGRALDTGDGSEDPDGKRQRGPYVAMVESEEEKEEEEEEEEDEKGEEQQYTCADDECYGQPRSPDYNSVAEEEEEEAADDDNKSVDSQATLVGNVEKQSEEASDDSTVDELQDRATIEPPGNTEGVPTEMDEENDGGGGDGDDSDDSDDGDDGGGDFVPNVPPASRVVMVLDITDAEGTRTLGSRAYRAELYYRFTPESVGPYFPPETQAAFNDIMESVDDFSLNAVNFRQYFSTTSKAFYPPFPECAMPSLKRLDVSFVVEYDDPKTVREIITENVNAMGNKFTQFLMGEYHDGIPEGCAARIPQPVPAVPDLPESLPEDFLLQDPGSSSALVPCDANDVPLDDGDRPKNDIPEEYDINVQPFSGTAYTNVGFTFSEFVPLPEKWSTQIHRGFRPTRQSPSSDYQWKPFVDQLSDYITMCKRRTDHLKRQLVKLTETKRRIRGAGFSYTMEDAKYYAEQYEPLLKDLYEHVNNCIEFVKQAIVLSPICAFMVRMDAVGAALSFQCRKEFHAQWKKVRFYIDDLGEMIGAVVCKTKVDDDNSPFNDLTLNRRALLQDYMFMQRQRGGAIWQFSSRGPNTLIEYNAHLEFVKKYIEGYIASRFGGMTAATSAQIQSELNSSEGYRAARWWLENYKETDNELVVAGS